MQEVYDLNAGWPDENFSKKDAKVGKKGHLLIFLFI